MTGREVESIRRPESSLLLRMTKGGGKKLTGDCEKAGVVGKKIRPFWGVNFS